MKETVKLIGNTPLYHIEDTNIYVKLEKYNIGGSIKDRAVLGMLDAAMNKEKSDRILYWLKPPVVTPVSHLLCLVPFTIFRSLSLCRKQ